METGAEFCICFQIRMGSSTSKYNVADRQRGIIRWNRKRSNISGRSGRSGRSSRSSSQPSITVRSPTAEGGLEEVIHESNDSSLKTIFNNARKVFSTFSCLKPSYPSESQESPSSIQEAGPSQVGLAASPKQTGHISRARSKHSASPKQIRISATHAGSSAIQICGLAEQGRDSYTRPSSLQTTPTKIGGSTTQIIQLSTDIRDTSRQTEAPLTKSGTFLPRNRELLTQAGYICTGGDCSAVTIDPNPPGTICRYHLSIEEALVQLFLEDSRIFFKKYGHFLANIPREIFYEASLKANITFPEREYEHYRRLQRSLSDSKLDLYSNKASAMLIRRRLPLSRREFMRHVPPEQWVRYSNISRSVESNLTFNVSYDVRTTPETHNDAQPCHSGTHNALVQVHSAANEADVFDDSVEPK